MSSFLWAPALICTVYAHGQFLKMFSSMCKKLEKSVRIMSDQTQNSNREKRGKREIQRRFLKSKVQQDGEKLTKRAPKHHCEDSTGQG